MPCVSDIKGLHIFPFLNSDSIMNIELAKYLATAEDISPHMDKLEWWKKHEYDLPHWSQACKECFACAAIQQKEYFTDRQNMLIGRLH